MNIFGLLPRCCVLCATGSLEPPSPALIFASAISWPPEQVAIEPRYSIVCWCSNAPRRRGIGGFHSAALRRKSDVDSRAAMLPIPGRIRGRCSAVFFARQNRASHSMFDVSRRGRSGGGIALHRRLCSCRRRQAEPERWTNARESATATLQKKEADALYRHRAAETPYTREKAPHRSASGTVVALAFLDHLASIL